MSHCRFPIADFQFFPSVIAKRAIMTNWQLEIGNNLNLRSKQQFLVF